MHAAKAEEGDSGFAIAYSLTLLPNSSVGYELSRLTDIAEEELQ